MIVSPVAEIRFIQCHGLRIRILLLMGGKQKEHVCHGLQLQSGVVIQKHI